MTYVDSWTQSDPLRRRLRRLTKGERREEAIDFLKLYHHELELPPADLEKRTRAVLAELQRTGSYTHTTAELSFGARVAWRNHANCIGRLYWKSLEVNDARDVTDPDEMALRVIAHLGKSTTSGARRSAITIFGPARDDRPTAYFDCHQLTQYAGYLRDDGVLGDPQNVEATRSAIALGWQPPATPSAFDLLPFVIRDATGPRRLYELPPGTVREVDIVHPTLPGIASLGLRWYTVPLVTDMILTIGGIDYPCAPFNGFYMATEIASRNFVDQARYNLLDRVGDAIGVDKADPYWKDRALTELNRAVLSSFNAAEAAIIDHHAASQQYIDFVRIEHALGRDVSGNWAWIVPPQASAACPVFHLPMTDHHDVPNFYRTRAIDGAALRSAKLTEQRGRTLRRVDRIKRRLRHWLRTRG
ncbi:nitric oxide synthase oxygenase [Glacieibacterium frigidum]|uniref:Nitric oxide synthase oxygenase n=1 Tax=Glacieibacterium frigidum TaxID=2593303 RepID=A0A552UHG6_9SPHN|nr:nitric oxide synthase oxygenase [Glacieibacterium frigidum]TRW17627.1 nitric oxide synthase oxygenase [Glacieibacterium frigidum]